MSKFLGALCLALVFVLGTAVPPAGASVDNAAIVKSWCDDYPSWMKWRGEGAWQGPINGDASYGDTKFCQTKYRIRDADPDYDYYAVQVLVIFRQRGFDGYQGGRATLSVASDRATQSNYYFATNDIQARSTCVPFSVGIQWEILSASGNFQICKGHGALLDRVSLSQTSARYVAPNVSKVKQFQVTFMQKVRRGVTPVFSGKLIWPYYKWHRPDAQHDMWWYEPGFGATTWSI